MSTEVASAHDDLVTDMVADAGALARKESQWESILRSNAYLHQKFVADAWCATFVWPKVPGALAEAAPTNELWRQIRDGQGISAAFESVKMFPPLVLRMLRIGETTGGLDRALLNVSYFYNREVKEGIDRVQAMIGPGMVLVLGTILGWVLLSIFGPLYDTISKLKL